MIPFVGVAVVYDTAYHKVARLLSPSSIGNSGAFHFYCAHTVLFRQHVALAFILEKSI